MASAAKSKDKLKAVKRIARSCLNDSVARDDAFRAIVSEVEELVKQNAELKAALEEIVAQRKAQDHSAERGTYAIGLNSGIEAAARIAERALPMNEQQS